MSKLWRLDTAKKTEPSHKMKGSNGVESVSEEGPLLGGQINSPVRKRRPPPDFCHITYFIFCLMGVGHLLPWNFFITASSYFEDKFTCPSTEVTNRSCSISLRVDFENYFAIAAMLPVCIMTAVNIWLQSLIHFRYRMYFSLFGLVFLFTITLAFVGVHTSHYVNWFFALTIFSVVIINFFSAIFQSSTFGFSGVFPPQYTTVVMGGQGIAGILAAIALIFSKLASSDHPTTSAFIYFSIAVVFVLICLLAFFIMLKMKFVSFHMNHTSVEVKKKNTESIIEKSTNARLDASPPFIAIFGNILVYAVSVFLVFKVTLSLFPAVLSHLKSNSDNPDNSKWTGTYFSPLVCFLMFNSADFSGRFITQWVTYGKNRYFLLVACILRYAFIPLFLMCNVGQSDTSVVPVLIKSDIVSVLLVALLGFTNGYFGSLAMIAAPMSIPQEQRETAATIMVFFLSFGLLSGSATSFIWTKAVLKIS